MILLAINCCLVNKYLSILDLKFECILISSNRYLIPKEKSKHITLIYSLRGPCETATLYFQRRDNQGKTSSCKICLGRVNFNRNRL